MHLVQLLLPVYDNDGRRQPDQLFRDVRAELTSRFGGMTAYTRAPAHGAWKEGDGRTAHDEIVVHEVMVEALDEAWWRDYRARLERDFRQDEIVVRAQSIIKL